MNIYRGDIFYIYKSGNVCGSEQDPGRPGVIVSNDIGNEHAPVVSVVFLSTKDKNNQPTHARVICKRESVAMCEQVYTVAKERIGDYIKTCTAEEMNEIDKCLRISLGLDGPIETNSDDEDKAKLMIELSESQKTIRGLQAELLKVEMEMAEERIQKQELADGSLKTSIERNLYRELYEKTLERLLKGE